MSRKRNKNGSYFEFFFYLEIDTLDSAYMIKSDLI